MLKSRTSARSEGSAACIAFQDGVAYRDANSAGDEMILSDFGRSSSTVSSAAAVVES